MSSPTLITLPNEMIARVVGHLGVEDCQQLRLTNKLLSVFASKELARLCFKTVNVSMTRYTLDALVRVCQHPIF